MEADTKLKELEEEFKVLKAEIRNVLLDIREVILDRTNPIGEDHESAHLTLDLNTTARTMAAEAASHEAMKSAEAQGEDEAVDLPGEADDDAPGPPPASAQGPEDEEGATGNFGAGASDDAPGPPPAASAGPDDEGEAPGEEPAPRVIRRTHAGRPEPSFQVGEERLPTEIPPMYQASIPPLNGTVAVSRWLTDALEAVGPQELDRIITIHRLWGNLPPNISRALAYLQELLNSTEEEEPRWLKVMQELDRLASL